MSARPRLIKDATVVVVLSNNGREISRHVALPGPDAARRAIMLISGRGERGLIAGDRLRVERAEDGGDE